MSRHQHRRRLLVEAGDEVGGGGGGVRPAARGGGDAHALLAAAVGVACDVLQCKDLTGGDLVRVLVDHLVVHRHRRVVVQADDDGKSPPKPGPRHRKWEVHERSQGKHTGAYVLRRKSGESCNFPPKLISHGVYQTIATGVFRAVQASGRAGGKAGSVEHRLGPAELPGGGVAHANLRLGDGGALLIQAH